MEKSANIFRVGDAIVQQKSRAATEVAGKWLA
jgi:hypothetical protein